MNQTDLNKNPVLKHSFDFALLIIAYCEMLQQQKQYILSRQLFRAGTSIGANIMEAQNAESKSDFIHQMKIAAKEGGETEYWLMLCHRMKNFPDCTHLLSKLLEIQKLLGRIIFTSKTATKV